jgi:glycosyltransferase involved in cell wall biosynthesis
MVIRGAVIVAAVDWNFLKQRVHHLAAGFAAAGVRVLFVENTGIRTPRLSDAGRIVRRLRTAVSGANGSTGEPLPENLEVLSPLILPLPYHRWAVACNFAVLRRTVTGFLERHNLEPGETILYSYLATPVVLRLADALPWGKVVYDVVSDPKLVEPRLAPYERRFLQRADLTLFASATLLEQYRAQTRNPVLFRDGFNVELLKVKTETPPEVAALPRPRLLYLGGINRKLWVEAVEAMALGLPEASVILVGPVAPEEVTLPKLPNLRWFPPVKRYADLAGYLRAADAGLIPYWPDPYAGAMHPAKLNEYLVFGLPVVATATPELKRLAAEWPEKTLYLAETPEKFVETAYRALGEDSIELREKRWTIPGENSWYQRSRDLITVLEGGDEKLV